MAYVHVTVSHRNTIKELSEDEPARSLMVYEVEERFAEKPVGAFIMYLRIDEGKASVHGELVGMNLPVFIDCDFGILVILS